MQCSRRGRYLLVGNTLKCSGILVTVWGIVLHEAGYNLHERIDELFEPLYGLSEVPPSRALAQDRCPQVESLHELPVVDGLYKIL